MGAIPNMKKIFIALICVCFIVCASSGCGGSDNKDIQSTSTTAPKEPISLISAREIFSDVFIEYFFLTQDLFELLDHFDNDTLISTEKIQEYESQLITLSNTAYELANTINSEIPPEECRAEWESFSTKLTETGSLLADVPTISINPDGQYDDSELQVFLYTTAYKFLAITVEIGDIATKLDSITASADSTTTTNPTLPSEQKCSECGKTATKTVELFGLTDYYCTAHYNEIMDIIGMMESDVGKGAASKHTCEECSNEGTHSIIGLTGDTEYYCTKHYNELNEFLGKLS